jgi:hypothetical protein
MGMQMAKYIHPMGIAGAGMIMHNPHPHTHLPGYEYGDLESSSRNFETCNNDHMGDDLIKVINYF